jgi:hypothetical protein
VTITQNAGTGRIISNAEAAPEMPSDMEPMRQPRAQATRALKRQQALPHLARPLGTAKMGAMIASRCCCISASAVMEGSRIVKIFELAFPLEVMSRHCQLIENRSQTPFL